MPWPGSKKEKSFSKMEDIIPIYHNEFGVAFQWKRNALKDILKIQLVFKDVGLLLTKNEVEDFSLSVLKTIESTCVCDTCANNEECKAHIVQTPALQIQLAMNYKEVRALNDLLDGTLFQLQLENLLTNL